MTDNDPTSIDCPDCPAGPGEPCCTPSRAETVPTHSERVHAYLNRTEATA
jgi:hypothetical protein